MFITINTLALRDSSLKIVVCLGFFLLGRNIFGVWMIGSVGRNYKSCLEEKTKHSQDTLLLAGKR